MLVCLDSSIISGYLSNEVPGLVTGLFHLAGNALPLRVELNGNFLRDIAGCRVEFQNPIPERDAKQLAKISDMQQGWVGQMTASYRVLRGPRSRSSAGPFTEPAGLKNMLFFEWFNAEKQRVLIQSWHMHMTVSAPGWQLSPQAERAQIRQNRARRKQFLLGDIDGGHLGQGVFSEDEQRIAFDFPSSHMVGLMESPPDQPPHSEQQESTRFTLINQVSTDLAMELRRFEMLLAAPGNMESKPAVLKLLTTAGDLAAHLSHALRNFATLKSSQWQFLLTDLEQSLPLFHAALTACDKLVDHSPPGTDLRWVMSVQRSLTSITSTTEQLMGWLRNG
jgi:hypothetical protein